MRFELAIVIECGPGGCRVKLVNNDMEMHAQYSALVKDRVRILPGQLVAVDMSSPTPEVAWRWYRTRVVESGEQVVIAQERERQLAAVRVAGLETTAGPGDEIWVTGMEGTWELHDRVLDDSPANPDRLRAEVLPRVQALLAA